MLRSAALAWDMSCRSNAARRLWLPATSLAHSRSATWVWAGLVPRWSQALREACSRRGVRAPRNALAASFDLVIASVHSKFRMGRREQTDRIVRAVENPHTTILGHVTGRQLLRRPGYESDMERILRACAQHGVAIEINAHPWRLDMDWRWCERALELGCQFSIDPDAHSTGEIDNVPWGVLMARKGAVPKERVLNALSLTEFGAFLKRRKS
jgi:DNA polymerase (family X)